MAWAAPGCLTRVLLWNVLARRDSLCQLVARKQKERKSTIWQFFVNDTVLFICAYMCDDPRCLPGVGSCANLCPLFSAGSWLVWTPVAPSMLLSYLKGNSTNFLHLTGLEKYFICEKCVWSLVAPEGAACHLIDCLQWWHSATTVHCGWCRHKVLCVWWALSLSCTGLIITAHVPCVKPKANVDCFNPNLDRTCSFVS